MNVEAVFNVDFCVEADLIHRSNCQSCSFEEVAIHTLGFPQVFAICRDGPDWPDCRPEREKSHLDLHKGTGGTSCMPGALYDADTVSSKDVTQEENYIT